MFAEGHRVDVLLDNDGAVKRGREETGDVEVVPAGHDGRAYYAAGAVVDGAGHVDANAEHVGGGTAFEPEELLEDLPDPARARPADRR